MVLDLSYINEQPSDEQEAAIQKAVEEACLGAIHGYLTQVADMMESKGIEVLNIPTVRAMAEEMRLRAENGFNQNEVTEE